MDAGRDVAGTYRPTAESLRRHRWLLVLFALAAVGQLVRAVLALADGTYGAATWHLGILLGGALLFWWGWTQRTVVSSDGIRVKRGRTWRTLTWDKIASVPQPGRWSNSKMLSVTTTAGDRVALHVPDSLWESLVAYADAHRQPDSGEDGPRLRDKPPQDAQ
jgi:hypothetical protein